MGLVDVAAVGARPQFELLGGKPAAGEVGAEGERADLVVAAVALGRESGGEGFGFGPVGADGMPALLLFAVDGVDSFVDDRVVAV